MACLGPVPWVERTLADGEHRLLEPGSASFGVLVRAAVIAPATQRRPAVRRQRRRAH
jgi:hypothetical protein